MKKNSLLRGGTAVILGVLMTAAFGAFSSFAYDSAKLNTCTIENGNSIVVTGTVSIDARPMAERLVEVEIEPGPGATIPQGAVAKKKAETQNAETPSAGNNAGTSDADANTVYVVQQQEEADDGNYYLFELQPYETGIGSRTDYIASCARTESPVFTLAFDHDAKASILYSRFVLALKTGDTYRPISNALYVTNPGDTADYADPYPEAMSKKGLLIEFDMLGDAMELGVKHTIVSIPYQYMLGGHVKYRYNGKDYYFDENNLRAYDRMISSFSSKGIVVTVNLLNGWNDSHPELHEAGLAGPASNAIYYGFNVSTKEGCETTRAIISFMAERYSGAHDEYGRVSNWIVGNEVNNQVWNYVGPMDINAYVDKYERVFRVAYTAIKSQSKNARVFFSTDYWWNQRNGSLQYSARDFIDLFAAGIRAEGDIEWGLSYHPYPHPMTEPEFWDDDQTGQLTDSEDSPVVSLYNIHILTDHMARPQLRTAGGDVRHIIFSEEGFTSHSESRGDVYDLQAAAFAYAYYLVDSNPYIDAFIISRQVDAPVELEQSCAFGLWTVDTEEAPRIVAVFPKNIYTVFKYIDTKKSLKYTEFAKEIIGISSWKDVIPNFNLEE